MKEPDVFKGNVFEYSEWINFIVIWLKRNIKATDRLYYLGRQTAGEARKSIKSFLALNIDDAYTKAKKLLGDRLGNKLIIGSSYREKIDKWPSIKVGDGKALHEYSDFLLQCETAMSILSHLKVLDDINEHQKITYKLPKDIQDSWLRYIDKWFYDEEGNEQIHDEYSPFSKLCQFISRQARIACNPLSTMS